jgi:hypothetical protein
MSPLLSQHPAKELIKMLIEQLWKAEVDEQAYWIPQAT